MSSSITREFTFGKNSIPNAPTSITSEAFITQDAQVPENFAQLVKPTPFKKSQTVSMAIPSDNSPKMQVAQRARSGTCDNTPNTSRMGEIMSPRHLFGPSPDSKVVYPR